MVAYSACLSLSVLRPFLSHVGGRLCLSAVRTPGRKGVSTPLQDNRLHVSCILTGVHYGDEICALMCSMVDCGVVLSKIFCQIVLSSHPIYQKLSLSRSVSDPVKPHACGS